MFPEYVQGICCKTPQIYNLVHNPSFRANFNPLIQRKIILIGRESVLSRFVRKDRDGANHIYAMSSIDVKSLS
jgi:hypothetical protein